MLFSCFNAVNASDVNETLIGDSGDVLTLESIDGEMLGANAASFNELANEIKNVGNGGTLSIPPEILSLSLIRKSRLMETD